MRCAVLMSLKWGNNGRKPSWFQRFAPYMGPIGLIALALWLVMLVLLWWGVF